MDLDTPPPLESTSLDKLYFLLREAHAEVEVHQHTVEVRKADVEAARKELDKATFLYSQVRGKVDDIELAIIDRRRAERGITLASNPPTTTNTPGGLSDDDG